MEIIILNILLLDTTKMSFTLIICASPHSGILLKLILIDILDLFKKIFNLVLFTILHFRGKQFYLYFYKTLKTLKDQRRSAFIKEFDKMTKPFWRKYPHPLPQKNFNQQHFNLQYLLLFQFFFLHKNAIFPMFQQNCNIFFSPGFVAELLERGGQAT